MSSASTSPRNFKSNLATKPQVSPPWPDTQLPSNNIPDKPFEEIQVSLRRFHPTTFWAWGYFLLCSAAFVVLILTSFYSGLFYNAHQSLYYSNSPYLTSAYHEFVRDKGTLLDWRLGTPTYLLPNTVIFLGLHSLTDNIHYVIAGYEAAVILLVYGGLFLIINGFTGHPLRALIAATLSILALYNVLFATLLPIDPAFQTVLGNSYHSSAFLGTLFSLWLATKYMSSSRISIITGALFLFCASTSFTASDPAYMLQFIVPTVATLFICGVFGYLRWSKFLLWANSLIAGSIAGLYIIGVFYPSFAPFSINTYKYGVQKLSTMSPSIMSLYNSLTHNMAYSIPFGVGLTSLIFVALYLLTNRVGKTERTRRRLALITLFSIATTCLSAILLSSVEASYLSGSSTLLLVPFFAGTTAVALICLKIFSIIPGASHLVLFSILGVIGYQIHSLGLKGFGKVYYPSDIQCVDNQLSQFDATHGIANQSVATRLQLLSQKNLNIIQVSNNLTPLPSSNAPKLMPEYDFAVVETSPTAGNAIDEFAIRDLNGEPIRVAHCNTMKLLLYGQAGLRLQ